MNKVIFPSLALIGSGAYLYWKNREAKNNADAGDGTSKSQSSADRIIASNKENGNTSVNTTDNYNSRDDKGTSTSKALYFGDPNKEYDQFYDYSIDPNVTEQVLKNSSAVEEVMSLNMRCRILSPFCGETGEKNIWAKGRYYTETSWGYSSIQELNKDGIEEIRECFGGTYRWYSFVIEVFNPYKVPAPLKKLSFGSIRIGDDFCAVHNPYGLCHQATQEQMGTNKHFYNYQIPNGWVSHKTTPYEMDLNVRVPAQDSVLIPVALPLTIMKPTILRYGWEKTTGYNSDTQKVISLLDYVGWKETNQYTKVDADAKAMVNNKNQGWWIFNECTAPKSIKDENVMMYITISSDKDNYSYNAGNGILTQENSKTCCLQMLHSYRKGYANNDDWQKSYIGDAEGKLPLVMTDPLDSLSEGILLINKGYPIEENFPHIYTDAEIEKIKRGVIETPLFTNDFNHENLG